MPRMGRQDEGSRRPVGLRGGGAVADAGAHVHDVAADGGRRVVARDDARAVAATDDARADDGQADQHGRADVRRWLASTAAADAIDCLPQACRDCLGPSTADGAWPARAARTSPSRVVKQRASGPSRRTWATGTRSASGMAPTRRSSTASSRATAPRQVRHGDDREQLVPRVNAQRRAVRPPGAADGRALAAADDGRRLFGHPAVPLLLRRRARHGLLRPEQLRLLLRLIRRAEPETSWPGDAEMEATHHVDGGYPAKDCKKDCEKDFRVDVRLREGGQDGRAGAEERNTSTTTRPQRSTRIRRRRTVGTATWTARPPGGRGGCCSPRW